MHRIGRTGRAGRQGRSFTLATPEDGKNVAAIQQLISKDIPIAVIPDLETAELDFSEGDRRRGRSRGTPARSTSRSERPEKRSSPDRPRRERGPAAEPPPVPVRPVKEPNVAVFPGPAARPAPRRPQAEPRRPQSEPDQRVVGFGDDLPAFLRRAPRVAARA